MLNIHDLAQVLKTSKIVKIPSELVLSIGEFNTEMDATLRTVILAKVSQVVQSSEERHPMFSDRAEMAHNWSNNISILIQECQTDQNF